jgi:hypothetical protein
MRRDPNTRGPGLLRNQLTGMYTTGVNNASTTAKGTAKVTIEVSGSTSPPLAARTTIMMIT